MSTSAGPRRPGGTRHREPLADCETDYRLMQAIAERDPAALASLYDRYGGAVFALCVRVLRDRGEAEDVLEEIFWEVWARSERYDPLRVSPLVYLMTLARSRAVDRWRHRRRRDPVWVESRGQTGVDGAGSGEASPLERALASESRVLVRRALDVLGPSQREAVELSFFDGLTHSEISERLGEPLGTIKTRIRQGLIRLRDALRSLYAGEER